MVLFQTISSIFNRTVWSKGRLYPIFLCHCASIPLTSNAVLTNSVTSG